MATTRRGLIFVTFLLSCVALAVLITALVTKMWVASDLTSSVFPGSVTYGLFGGTLEIAVLSNQKTVFDITLTCLISENVCAWTCQNTAELREEEVQSLLDSGQQLDTLCKSTSVTTAGRVVDTVDPLLTGNTTAAVPDQQFVNAGLWISTLFFLAVALLVTAIAALLGVLNAASNPSSSVLAPDGMMYWNGIAASLDLLCLVLWGAQFGATLTDNVALAHVISGDYTSKGLASLGYSYWLLLVALLSSLANVGVLVLREYMIRREPPQPTFRPQEPASDGVIFLY